MGLVQMNSNTGVPGVNSLISQGPAAVTTAAQITSAIQQASNGVAALSNGQTINARPLPTSLSLTVSSNNGGSATNVNMTSFNESFLTASPTANGSGAASVSSTYGDGFNGRLYEQLFKNSNNGQGVLITGFTISATNFTSGAQINTPFNIMNLTLSVANGNGGLIPFSIKLQEAVRNTQFQVGILTPEVPFYMNSMAQLAYVLPFNTTLAFTFFTNASTF